jgi:pilus assembly protein CpaC
MLALSITTTPAAGQPAPAPAEIRKVDLTAGRSTVLTTDFDITRIAVTNPAVADAVVVQAREVLIDGKGAARAAAPSALSR